MEIVNDKNIKKQIIDSLELSSFTAVQQNRIINSLINNISAKVFIAVLDKLTTNDQKEFKKVLKLNNKTKTLNFLNSKINNLESLVNNISQKIIEDFRKKRTN